MSLATPPAVTPADAAIIAAKAQATAAHLRTVADELAGCRWIPFSVVDTLRSAANVVDATGRDAAHRAAIAMDAER